MALSSKFKTGLKITVAFGLTLAVGIGGYAYTAKSVSEATSKARSEKTLTLTTLLAEAQTSQNALKQSATKTLAFLSSHDDEVWNQKKREDANFGASQTRLRETLTDLPDTANALQMLDVPLKRAVTVCNLLEAEALQLGSFSNSTAIAKFVSERYLPALTEREARLNGLTQELETLRLKNAEEGIAATALLQRSLKIGWGIEAGMIFLAGIMAVWLLSGLNGRLDHLIYTVRGLANGDTSRELTPEPNGELSELTAAIREVAVYQSTAAQTVKAISDGDLTQVIVPRSRKDALNSALEKMVGTLQESLLGMDEKIKTLESTLPPSKTADWDLTQLHGFRSEAAENTPLAKASHLASQLQFLLQERDAIIFSPTLLEQTRTLSQSVAQEAGETVTGVSQVAENSQATAQLADENRTAFRRTATDMVTLQSEMTTTAETLLRLGQRSQEALNVIGALQETAERTDAIALNAAIEAARAGSQGTGFSAVAEQMRGLAERSSQAAQEVRNWMQQIQEETRGAFEIAQRGSLTLQENIVTASGSADSLGTVTSNLHQIAQTAGETVDIALRTQQSAEAAALSANEASVCALNEMHILTNITKIAQELTALLGDLTSPNGLIVSSPSESGNGSRTNASEVEGVTRKLREQLSFFKIEMPENAAVTTLLTPTHSQTVAA